MAEGCNISFSISRFLIWPTAPVSHRPLSMEPARRLY